MANAKEMARKLGMDLTNPNPSQTRDAGIAIDNANKRALEAAEQTIVDQTEIINGLTRDLDVVGQVNKDLSAAHKELEEHYEKLQNDMIEQVGDLKEQLDAKILAFEELMVKSKKLQDQNKELKDRVDTLKREIKTQA